MKEEQHLNIKGRFID